MNTVSRHSRAGQVFGDLRKKAKEQSRPVSELLTLYALEGFLGRLSESAEDRGTFVLKGGVLLGAYDSRRPTRDADLLGQDLSNEAESIHRRVTAIAARVRDDGLILDTSTITAEVVRDEDDYSGVRVSLTYGLASAVLRFHVDVSVGDPVWPPPQEVLLPGLLEGEISLRGYPLTAALAEKTVTAVQRGEANTRWRDYADIYNLSGTHSFSGAELTSAIDVVAEHRKAELEPLAGLLESYPGLAQTRWAAWRSRQSHRAALPPDFETILAAVAHFVDPVSAGLAAGQFWDPAQRIWA
ncbi:MAG: hypothetical protein QG671_423 [Actinomycetota bacterium]|nr:hypothetical protein [Actinomycetota bacterium]